MMIDATETVLTPGNLGKYCMGNGEHPESDCCCDQCDYLLCCLDSHDPTECGNCREPNCPHSNYAANTAEG